MGYRRFIRITHRISDSSVLVMVSIAVSFFPLITVASFADDPPALLITEFMAANTDSVADGDGEYPDWIELYNAGSEAVSINSWYMTDDLENPERWCFPPADVIDLTIPHYSPRGLFAAIRIR